MSDKDDGMEFEIEDIELDYEKQCEVCGNSPVVVQTGMCEPCTFGEAP